MTRINGVEYSGAIVGASFGGERLDLGDGVSLTFPKGTTAPRGAYRYEVSRDAGASWEWRRGRQPDATSPRYPGEGNRAARRKAKAERRRGKVSDLHDAVWSILVEECGAKEEQRARFVEYAESATHLEWRFMGTLGFGGKVHRGQHGDRGFWVSAYPEDMTPERRAAIDRANARLDALPKGGAK